MDKPRIPGCETGGGGRRRNRRFGEGEVKEVGAHATLNSTTWLCLGRVWSPWHGMPRGPGTSLVYEATAVQPNCGCCWVVIGTNPRTLSGSSSRLPTGGRKEEERNGGIYPHRNELGGTLSGWTKGAIEGAIHMS